MIPIDVCRTFRDANSWLSLCDSELPTEPARALVEVLTSASPSPEACRILGLERRAPGLVTSAAICSGRGSFKTTIACIAAVDRLLRFDHSGVVALGSEVCAVVISPTKAQSSMALRNARPICEKSAALLGGRLRERSAADSAELIFELGLPYTPIFRVAPADEAAVRGAATCAVVFDEASWFPTGDQYANTDEALETAATPRILQFGERGLFLRVSTPGLIGGRFHRDVTEPKPGTLVLGPFPTWRINPSITEAAAREKFPTHVFEQEFACRTWGARESQFISQTAAMACVDRGPKFARGPRPLPSAIVAVDVANIHDPAAFAVGYLAEVEGSGSTEPTLVIDHCERWVPSPGSPIATARIAERAAALSRAYGGISVIADQRSYIDLGEELEKRGFKVCLSGDEEERQRWIRRGGRVLVMRPMAPQAQTPRWVRVKDQVHARRLSLPDDDAGRIAAKELAGLRATQLPSRMLKVEAASGQTDDVADCIALLAEACTWRPTVREDGTRIVHRQSMQGSFDRETGAVTLDVDRWVKVLPNGKEVPWEPDPAHASFPDFFVRQLSMPNGEEHWTPGCREFCSIRIGTENPTRDEVRRLLSELHAGGECAEPSEYAAHPWASEWLAWESDPTRFFH